jgi:glycosyltransferase involved in cell wall biosynthesis
VRTLHVTYFGLREPLVQTQVLPYLRELTARGATVFLLTFEPAHWDHREWRERLRGERIEWFAARYHKRPTLPATLYDVIAGALRVVRIVRRHGIDIIHARSDVPALMGVLAKRLTRAKVLFDIRGLVADEYAEMGNWRPDGMLYRMSKRVERHLQRNADGIIVLTERLRREIFVTDTRPVEVIPCCIDPARFSRVGRATRDRVRASLGLQDHLVIVYAGALGGMYLPHEMADFFATARSIDPRVYPMILTQSRRELIEPHLRARGFTESDFFIGFARPDELPEHLVAADAAISFVKAGRSMIARSPTKFAEYLAAELPVISTRGVGDLDAQIQQSRVGVLLDGFDRASYTRAFQELLDLRRDEDLPRRCRELVANAYDLHSIGGERYARIYRQLGAK